MLTLTAKNAAAGSCKTICDLKRCNKRHHLANKLNNFNIVAEEVSEDLGRRK